jgi:hypothetical protein
MQQSSSGVFDSEPVWKLTVDTSSISFHSMESIKGPFQGHKNGPFQGHKK